MEWKTFCFKYNRLEQRQSLWIEPFKKWTQDAVTLGAITQGAELHPKKSAAQKIFGLNLFLKNQKIESTPQTQWAAVAAAHSKVGKYPLCKILVPLEGIEPPSLP